MNIVMTMALGSRVWGDFALNLCLSIRSTFPKAKIALIHDGAAILGLEEQVEQFFDYSYRVQDSGYTTAYEHAFRLKTKLWQISQLLDPKAKAYLFLDADVIMLPGRSVDEWFNQLKEFEFTAWCNDAYDFRTGNRSRSDYTFWCEPSDLSVFFKKRRPELELEVMPQINSSFLYFKNCMRAEDLFYEASKVMETNRIDLKEEVYKGVRPDELCFNVACLTLKVLPHQIPFYPVFFQFASEHHEELYIQSNWPAMGFAGEARNADHLVAMYNRFVNYYRKMFDIDEPFKFDNTLKALIDTNPIRLEAKRKRTLYRRGEVAGSDGGIFNPSGLTLSDGSLMTIFRKEANCDINTGYKNASAVPFLQTLKRNKYREEELRLEGFPEGVRVEDFRLFIYNKHICCSHTVIERNLQKEMRSTVAISKLVADRFVLATTVPLPIQVRQVEKNWVFVQIEDHLYCVYSAQPYQLFVLLANGWEAVERKQPDLKWFHYNQPICNSTNPIAVDEYYLMWFHTKENGVYHHGALLLDGNLEIKFATRNSIIIKDSAIAEGIMRGIVYVSGCMLVSNNHPQGNPSLKKGGELNTVRVFFGEGDSSSCYVDYDKEELLNVIKKYPI